MKSESMRLLIRADASTEMGTGHVMRCLALAQAWQDIGGESLLISASGLGSLEGRLMSEGLVVERMHAVPGSEDDARSTVELARRCVAGRVVIDGYQFSGGYQRFINEAGLWTLAVDDYGHAEHYWADAILNQNLHAEVDLYPNRESTIRLLLGPRYALLRREFWKWRGWERNYAPIAKKVLVTLGGSDPENVTLKVVAALARLKADNLEAVVIVGASNPHLPALRNSVPDESSRIRIMTDVKDMGEVMAWADMALSAGGSTCWELAFMGLPALTIVLAENQVTLAAGLAAHGVARNMGWYTDLAEQTLADAIEEILLDCTARRNMGIRGQVLVDGEGGHRVARVIAEVPV